MCMTCGCNNPDVDKQDQITREDLERAARAQGTTVDEVVDNLQKTHASTASA